MRAIKTAMSLIGAMSIATVLQTAAQATQPTRQPPPPPTPQTRTYVSGTGSDSNPCTATSPCLTFAAALALTVATGEIYVLDSANYGPVTINKAVTITSEGAMGGVLGTSGAAITISAGANDVVNLRGLDIDGGNTGSVGVQFNSGQALNIQKSIVHNFTSSGINFSPSGASTLLVSETTVANNGSNGISLNNNATGAISRVTVSKNGVGILAFGNGVSVTVTDAVAGNNTYGIGASSAAVMVRNSTVSNNSVGISADQSAVVRVGQSTITANGTGWQASNNGQVISFGNNNLAGNTSDGTASTTVALE